MTKDEMLSIEKGDVIYYPPSEEWWKVIGFKKKYKFFGRRFGAVVKCEEGYMAKFGPISYLYSNWPGNDQYFLNFYKLGVLIKNDSPGSRLAIQLKHS